MENFKALYTAKEVSQIVYSGNIAPGTIRLHALSGKIPSTRFGTKFFIPGYWVKQQLEFGLGSAEEAEKAIQTAN